MVGQCACHVKPCVTPIYQLINVWKIAKCVPRLEAKFNQIAITTSELKDTPTGPNEVLAMNILTPTPDSKGFAAGIKEF